MDKYRRVEKSKAHDAAPVEANEIRITQQGNVRSYISYANGLFAVRPLTLFVANAQSRHVGQWQYGVATDSQLLLTHCRRRTSAVWCSKRWAMRSAKP